MPDGQLADYLDLQPLRQRGSWSCAAYPEAAIDRSRTFLSYPVTDDPTNNGHWNSWPPFRGEKHLHGARFPPHHRNISTL
jgi:hypothetical protein